MDKPIQGITVRAFYNLGVNMDKKEAVKKLRDIFGDMDIIGVLHTIMVAASKYIIIILFAIYTWHCFTVFLGNNTDRKEKESCIVFNCFMCNFNCLITYNDNIHSISGFFEIKNVC